MSTASGPEEINVSVHYTDGATARVVWSRVLAFPNYEIAIKVLNGTSEEVRSSLNRLIDRCMSDGAQSCGEELRELAVSGHRLYNALFTKTGGEGNADAIKEWFRGRPAGSRLFFTVSKLVHVPWGLIFDVNPERLDIPGGATDIDFYGHFWCLKYELATTYYALTPAVLDAPPKTAASFKMLSVVNKETHDDARKHLQPPEAGVQGWLESSFPAPLHSRRALLKEWWDDEEEKIDMLYFYCHSNGDRIDVGDEKPITTTDFSIELKRAEVRENRSYCMVFLNGCSTAAGEPGGGFLEATGSYGYCGFIGPEVEIPDVFALRFGLAFLYYFLKRGWPVYRVMSHLRRKHWPLSLIYSICCNPMLRVEAAVGDGEAEVAFENFSDGVLGTSGTEDARI